METIKLIFSADHVAPHYAAVEQEAEATSSNPYNETMWEGHVVWSASSRRYGCGKNASTPEEALTRMLMDHGCYSIKVRRA